MAIAEKGEWYDFIKSCLNSRDENHLPTFKVNFENNNKDKIIDICRSKMTVDNNLEYLEIIQLLRKCGSLEPKSPIIQQDAGLNIRDVHNPVNDIFVPNIKKQLDEKYCSNTLTPSDCIKEIEAYINNNEGTIGDTYEIDVEAARKKLQTIDLNGSTNQHNLTWSFAQELKNVWLYCKEHETTVAIISCLSQAYACEWGKLVNLYYLTEKNEVKVPTLIIDFMNLDTNNLTNQVCETLSKRFVQNAADVLKKFWSDIWLKKQAKDFDIKTEVVLGTYCKVFEEKLLESNKNINNITTEDMNMFHSVIKLIVLDRENCDLENNKLYEIIGDNYNVTENFDNN